MDHNFERIAELHQEVIGTTTLGEMYYCHRRDAIIKELARAHRANKTRNADQAYIDDLLLNEEIKRPGVTG